MTGWWWVPRRRDSWRRVVTRGARATRLRPTKASRRETPPPPPPSPAVFTRGKTRRPKLPRGSVPVARTTRTHFDRFASKRNTTYYIISPIASFGFLRVLSDFYFFFPPPSNAFSPSRYISIRKSQSVFVLPGLFIYLFIFSVIGLFRYYHFFRSRAFTRVFFPRSPASKHVIRFFFFFFVTHYAPPECSRTQYM